MESGLVCKMIIMLLLKVFIHGLALEHDEMGLKSFQYETSVENSHK